MRKLLILAALIHLSACATSSTIPTTTESTEVENYQDTAVVAEKTTETKEEVVDKKGPPVENALYAALNDAIKQQNDDHIQKASAEILTQNSKDLRALNALALVYYKRGRFEASQYLLNKALAANPNSAEVYSNLGIILLAKGERREAIKMFRTAIQTNPDDALAGANLGAIYIQEKNYNKAFLALEIPVKKGMKDPKILNNFAISLAAIGRPNESAEIYARLLKDNPSQKDVMLNYSILLIDDMKKYKEGLDLLNRLKFVGAAPESRQVIKDLENKAKAGLQ